VPFHTTVLGFSGRFCSRDIVIAYPLISKHTLSFRKTRLRLGHEKVKVCNVKKH
jgi:hypothetical protein